MSKDTEITETRQQNCSTSKPDSNDCYVIKSYQNDGDGGGELDSIEQSPTQQSDAILSQRADHAVFPTNKKQVQAYSIRRINYKSQFVIHWSNTRLFTRLRTGDDVPTALPLIVKLRRQKICLTFSKTFLDVVSCLRNTEDKLMTIINYSREIRLHDIAHVTETLLELSNVFNTTFQNFQRAYKDLSDLDCFEHVILALRKNITSESIKYSCNRIFKMLANLSGEMVDLKAIEKPGCIASSISISSIFQKKLVDFVKSLCYYISEKDLHTNLLVDFSDATRNSNILSSNKCLTLDVLSIDICSYLWKAAEKRSFLVSTDLSMATLNCVKTYIAESSSSRFDLMRSLEVPQNKTRAIVRILKHIYKGILERENEYFATLMEEIECVNRRLLKKNTDVLYRHFSPLPNDPSKKVVSWDSNIVPVHRDLLFGLYMDVLWKRIKKQIMTTYLNSLYEKSECACRLSNSALVSFELELLRQINLILSKKGDSISFYISLITLADLLLKICAVLND